jgi:hypothetical protein
MSGNPHLIDSRSMPRGEELRVELVEYRGKVYLNARKWWRAADGELRPGKGLSLPANLLPWLRRAVEQAEAAALADGLLDEEAFEAAGLPLPVALGGRP